MANKPVSAHNEVTIQPPPGATFMFWGSNLILRFERGKEREIFQWFANWNQQQIFPLVLREEARVNDVQPDYSGINTVTAAPVETQSTVIANNASDVACPMGCGYIVDATGARKQNINPACPDHGNPDALYGRQAASEEDLNNE